MAGILISDSSACYGATMVSMAMAIMFKASKLIPHVSKRFCFLSRMLCTLCRPVPP